MMKNLMMNYSYWTDFWFVKGGIKCGKGMWTGNSGSYWYVSLSFNVQEKKLELLLDNILLMCKLCNHWKMQYRKSEIENLSDEGIRQPIQIRGKFVFNNVTFSYPTRPDKIVSINWFFISTINNNNNNHCNCRLSFEIHRRLYVIVKKNLCVPSFVKMWYYLFSRLYFFQVLSGFTAEIESGMTVGNFIFLTCDLYYLLFMILDTHNFLWNRTFSLKLLKTGWELLFVCLQL